MSPDSHLLVEQSFWLEDAATSVVCFWIVTEAREESITITTQARLDGTYDTWLGAAGFEALEMHPGYGRSIDPGFMVLTAQRR